MRFNPIRSVAATSTAALPQNASPQPQTDWLAQFIGAYGQPNPSPAGAGEGGRRPDEGCGAAHRKVPLPYGHMAVTLALKYNDSAPQVDHFEYHAGLGCPDFALLIVPKQAQTEKLARRALALCPALAIGDLDWTWKAEQWRNGHGNYLQSSTFSMPQWARGCTRKTFGGDPVDLVHWEIEFTTNLREGQLVELHPHRNFRNSSLSAARGGEGRGEVARIVATWCINLEKNGVEVHFSRRPDDAALQPLRDDRRWRYTGFSRCWYARRSPETEAWANDFVARFNSPSLSANEVGGEGRGEVARELQPA